MYKLKYYSLEKKEKIKLKEEFYQTEYGQNLKVRLNRLFITGILGVLFSLYLFIFHQTKWDIVTGSILTLASMIFIIGSFKVRIDKINDYLVRKKK